MGIRGRLNTYQAVLGLELLHGLGGVVDQGETSRLTTTKLCPQTEDADLLGGSLVHGGKLLAEILLGNAGLAWVEDIAREMVSGILWAERKAEMAYTIICFY
jgi:hypothetical protein